jgi:hypothetical protein
MQDFVYFVNSRQKFSSSFKQTTRRSLSKRAGLILSVSRILGKLKNGNFAKVIQKGKLKILIFVRKLISNIFFSSHQMRAFISQL